MDGWMDGLKFQFFQFERDRRRRTTDEGATDDDAVASARRSNRARVHGRVSPRGDERRTNGETTEDAEERMGDDGATRARGVGGRCRSILRAASDALTRCETRLNEVNEKYTFELCPEYRLKVSKTIGTTRVGMTFDARERRYRVAVKRAESMDGEDESERDEKAMTPLFWRAMNKLVLDPEEKRIELYSRRVDYGPLSLRGVGEYNATDGEWGLRWQLQTFQKEKKRLRSAEYELNDHVRGCLRWDVQSVAPEVEGAVGSKEKFSFDVDVGSYHVTVPRLEVKVDL